jgi:integrase
MPLSLYPQVLTEQHLREAYPEHWTPELKQTVFLWLRDLQTGFRPLTPRSIQTMRERFLRYTIFLKNELHLTPLPLKDCLEVKTVYRAISAFPIESYSNRHNTFYAIHSLARFLIRIGELEECYLTQLKKFRPRRVLPPKRTVLRDVETLEVVRNAIQPENFRSPWICLLLRTLIETLVHTGLRNAELCKLRLEDVDLADRRLIVQLGKGRKPRQVGISKVLLGYLEAYLEERSKRNPTSDHFFLSNINSPLTPTSLGRLIKKVSHLSGQQITTHGLRRTFATLNAEQGRPLHLIQLALGHSDIRTTQEYLMTDQEAVIDAMKEW